MKDQARKVAAMALDERLAAAHPMRPLFIGQAPGRGLDGWPALTGTAGDRLAELAQLPGFGRGALRFMFAAERINVFDVLPASDRPLSAADPDPFPMPAARAAANAILSRYSAAGTLEGRRIVFVGRAVAEAFEYLDRPFFSWDCDDRFGPDGQADRFRFAVIPHPSGRNRFWNIRANVDAATAFLSAIFRDGAE